MLSVAGVVKGGGVDVNFVNNTDINLVSWGGRNVSCIAFEFLPLDYIACVTGFPSTFFSRSDCSVAGGDQNRTVQVHIIGIITPGRINVLVGRGGVTDWNIRVLGS